MTKETAAPISSYGPSLQDTVTAFKSLSQAMSDLGYRQRERDPEPSIEDLVATVRSSVACLNADIDRLEERLKIRIR